MREGRFRLSGQVSSDDPDRIRPLLPELFPEGRIRDVAGTFEIEAELTGPSAKEVNRIVLSTLRRAERRTRLRAQWTDDQGTTYRFFDYVLKRTTRP